MKAVISVPQGIITGVFNVRVSCFDVMPLVREHVEFVTVAGDALGGEWSLVCSGASGQITYYPAEDVQGESEVRLVGLQGRVARVKYDTYRSVVASFGEVRYDNNKAILPVRFEHVVVGLAKRHFRVEGASRCNLYGKDRDYELHIVKREEAVCVDIVRQVCKASGVLVDVDVVKRWL